MRNAQIVSPSFPTGSSWLLNCLLELGIRTTTLSEGWFDCPDGFSMLPEHVRDSMRWQLPILARENLMRFRDDGPIEAIYWGHQLNYTHFPARKTILCVRDLPDTVYSQFRRRVSSGNYQQTEAELLAFLTQPEIHPEHFPHLFDLPPADTLAYYYLLCLEMVPAKQLLVVKFEDRLANPERELRRVLDFLGIARSDGEIATALAHSELDQVLALQHKRQQHQPGACMAARAGKSGEARQVFSPAALACFAGPAAKAQAALGYEPLPVSTLPESDLALPPERAAQATSMFAQYYQLLSQGQQAHAAALMQGMLRATSHDLALRTHLSGQLLGLLWTWAIMGLSASHLPMASQMANFFFGVNAEFAAWAPLARAAAKITNPHHVLHSLSFERLFRSPDQAPAEPLNPAKLIYFRPELHAEADFGKAGWLALNSGLRYFLWKHPRVQLDGVGLSQLYGLLQKMTYSQAIMPVLQAPSDAHPDLEAYRQHARLGAAFAPITLTSLPDCILFKTQALLRKPLEQPPASWLGELRVNQAMGVLAFILPA